ARRGRRLAMRPVPRRCRPARRRRWRSRCSRSCARPDAHAVATRREAREHTGLAVDRDAALAADAHAAERRARLAADADTARPAEAQQQRGDTLPRPRLVGFIVDPHPHAGTATIMRLGSKGEASIAVARPSNGSITSRAVPSAVVTPRPSWPAAIHTPS